MGICAWLGLLTASGQVPEKAFQERVYQKAQAEAGKLLMTNLRSPRTSFLPCYFGQANHEG